MVCTVINHDRIIYVCEISFNSYFLGFQYCRKFAKKLLRSCPLTNHYWCWVKHVLTSRISCLFVIKFYVLYIFIGDNGSGKTTVIAKLQGVEDSKKGSGLEYAFIEEKGDILIGSMLNHFLRHIGTRTLCIHT